MLLHRKGNNEQCEKAIYRDQPIFCAAPVLAVLDAVAKSCLTLITPWTVAHQAPLSMGFSRQEYWSGLSCPPPEDLSNPRVNPRFPTLQADSLPSKSPGKPKGSYAATAAKSLQSCPSLCDPMDCSL